jgi:hypothetical protein
MKPPLCTAGNHLENERKFSFPKDVLIEAVLCSIEAGNKQKFFLLPLAFVPNGSRSLPDAILSLLFRANLGFEKRSQWLIL